MQDICDYLTDICSIKLPDGVEEAFVTEKILDMSIQNFLERCQHYFKCTLDDMLKTLLLIYQLLHPLVQGVVFGEKTPTTSKNPIWISHDNVMNLYGTVLLIVTKVEDDFHISNSKAARVLGLTLQKINQFEVEFLFMTQFNLISFEF